MADIGIFGVYQITLSFPGECIIADTLWEAVVTKSDYHIVLVGYHRSSLGRRVFGAFGNRARHTHKAFVPGDIVFAVLGGHTNGSLTDINLAYKDSLNSSKSR